MNRTSRCAVLSTISAALVLVGCGSDAAPDASSGSGAPTVLATTSIWADITANVACDGLADIETIIPLGGDPHAFEPSLRDRETMENAAMIVANGLLLEESLADTISAVEDGGVPVLRVGDGLDTLPIDDHDETEHDEGEHDDGEHDDGDHADAEHEETEHEHGDADPHIWFDPTLVADAVPGIVDALVEVGIDRAALETCADAYLTELATLDTDIAAIVAPLATDARLLVTNHDSLGYFAHRYAFEVLGSIVPSSSSLAEANPADLDDLAARIEATGVPAIFAESQHSSSDADALADRLDVDVVTLMTATLDEPGSPAGTYVGWLRTTATSIVDALTAGEPG